MEEDVYANTKWIDLFKEEVHTTLINLIIDVRNLTPNYKANISLGKIKSHISSLKKKYKALHCKLALHFLNGAVCLKAYEFNKEKHYLDIAYKNAYNIFSIKKQFINARDRHYNELCILLGIDELFMKLLDPMKIDFSICPTLQHQINDDDAKSIYPCIEISEVDIRRQVLSNSFYQVIAILNTTRPKKLGMYFKNNTNCFVKNEISLFRQFVKKVVLVDSKISKYLQSALNLEQAKYQLVYKCINNDLCYCRNDDEENDTRLSNLNDSEFVAKQLVMRNGVKIIHHLWHPSINVYHFTFNISTHINQLESIVAIKPDRLSIRPRELILDPVCGIILNNFKKSVQVKHAIAYMLGAIYKYNTLEYARAEFLLLVQVRSFVKNGLLTES